MEQALRSQTLKFLETRRSREPTSHNAMSPTLVPTKNHIEEESIANMNKNNITVLQNKVNDTMESL